MKPLRNLLAVKPKNLRIEKQTESGIVIVSGEALKRNFKDDDSIKMNVIYKAPSTKKTLNNRLLEQARKKSGTLIDFVPPEQNQNILSLEGDEALKDLVYGRKDNSGEVVFAGKQCTYQCGENVIFKKGCGIEVEYNSDKLRLVEESDVLAVEKDGNYRIHPDCVLVKITKESRENVFKRKVKAEDGTESIIFIPPATDRADERHSQFFVTCGEILQVGANVQNVKEGDTAILDYTQDNDDTIIVGYEGEDKLIVVRAVTSRHNKSLVIDANRRSRRTQIVYEKGEYDITSNVYGVIRNNDLIAIDPYIFFKHESTKVEKKTSSGILYAEQQKIIQREVLSISKEGSERLGVNAGDVLVLDDYDVFDITLEDKVIHAIFDNDVLGAAKAGLEE